MKNVNKPEADVVEIPHGCIQNGLETETMTKSGMKRDRKRREVN